MPHRSLVRALVAGLTATLTLSGAAAHAQADTRADARDDAETVRVAKRATLTLTGHGYGHGRGMSQYGAQGAATQGLTYDQILAFYYPGLVPAPTTGRITVLVSADSTDDVEVTGRGLVVRDLATKEKAALGDDVRGVRLLPAGAGTTVQALTDRWRTVRTTTGEAEVKGRGPLTLTTPSGRLTYRGWLRSAAPRPGSATRDTVNVLPLEQYLRGVVPREIPASWAPAAVQAQAVAARTYADFGRANPVARHYQVCDTTSCQVYAGTSAEHPAATAAVRATKGVVLSDGAGPGFTQFSASSGGWTAAGSMPYLAAQPDPYDGWAGNPVHTWTTSVSAASVQARYPAVGTLRSVTVTGRDGNGDWGGRVTQLVVAGTAGQVTVTGDDWRTAFGLRSTWFTLAVS